VTRGIQDHGLDGDQISRARFRGGLEGGEHDDRTVDGKAYETQRTDDGVEAEGVAEEANPKEREAYGQKADDADGPGLAEAGKYASGLSGVQESVI